MKLSPAIPVACLALFVAAVLAEDAKPTAPKKISTLEATNYYNQTMVVTGKVVQVTVRPNMVYINLDKKFPASPMSFVIFPKATNEFPEVKKLQGKQVEIKGKIVKYNDKPEIVLSSSNQVTVIETSTNAAPKVEAK